MRYSRVCLETIACVLPEEVVTSTDLEARLRPLYERLRLPEGRLELMTGIRERRVWPAGMLPSQAAAQAGARALAQAGREPGEIGAVFHCGVCRDFLEPATATSVHRLLGLSPRTLNFDLSNACLGVLSGMVAAANMIELGQIDHALIVTGEHSRPLMEATLDYLLRDLTLTRQSCKNAFASLTIGSAAAAVLLSRDQASRTTHRFLGGASCCDTRYNHLCQGNADGGMGNGARPLMNTDSEALLLHGVEVAATTWADFKMELGWDERSPSLVCTHQVGRVHRERLYNTLGLDLANDFATIETMGNCGSASLPATLALAIQAGRVQAGQKVAMLGIGSGINCTMLGIEWGEERT